MEATQLQVETRTVKGKNASRQLRMHEQIPGVLYGPGMPTLALTLSPKELTKALTSPRRRNVLFSLTVDGSEHFAMIKEVQIHPVTRVLLHADFYRVDPAASVDVRVALRTEGKCPGVVAGGELRTSGRDLPVRARPDSIPEEILVDVSNLGMMQEVKVSDLPLGEGVSVPLPADNVVVWVGVPRRGPDEAGAGAGDGEGAGEAAAGGDAPADGAPPAESKG